MLYALSAISKMQNETVSLLSLTFTGDPLHNLTELHTTWQHTTELYTTLPLGGVLARLCAPPGNSSQANQSDSNVGWANASPTSGR